MSALPILREPEPKRPLRLLYVVSLFPCWSETFICREISKLLERGAEVQILSLRPPEERLVQKDASRLLSRVHYPVPLPGAVGRVFREVLRRPSAHARLLLELSRALLLRPFALLKSLVTWFRATAQAPYVREFSPDLIHAHWATYPSTAALLLSRTTGFPFSFTSHAHDIFVEDHLLALKLREARFAVTISEFNRAFLGEKLSQAAAGRIEVVRCGIEPEELPMGARGREAGSLLSVGRLDPIKGFSVLIEALALLKGQGRAFRAEILGEGPLREELARKIRDLGLEGRVVLPGAVAAEEVLERMGRAALFVLPSVVAPGGNRDGVPVALMEAMAKGAPVVSTRVSGIPELVSDGTSGLLVDPGDPAALASAIASLLDDPERAAHLASRARAEVEERFNLGRESDRLLSLMERAVVGVKS